MRLWRSLSARLVMAFMLLAGLALGVAMLATTRAVEAAAEEKVREDLSRTLESFQHLAHATQARLRDVARAQTLDPSGTAGSYRGYVAVDVPLPWPDDIADHPTVAPVAGALAAAGLRVQGTVPDPADGDGTRLATFLRPPGPFVAYEAAA